MFGHVNDQLRLSLEYVCGKKNEQWCQIDTAIIVMEPNFTTSDSSAGSDDNLPQIVSRSTSVALESLRTREDPPPPGRRKRRGCK